MNKMRTNTIKIVLLFVAIIFQTSCMNFFEWHDYVQEDERSYGWNDDLEVHLSLTRSLSESCKSSHGYCFILCTKEVCREPYELVLKVSGVNVLYTNIAVNFANIQYDDGEKITIKENDGKPLILDFQDYAYWENGGPVKGKKTNTVFHHFAKKIYKKHQEGQKFSAIISLTLIPGGETKEFNGSFVGVVNKDKATLFEMIEGI